MGAGQDTTSTAFIHEVCRFTSFVPLTIPHATTSRVTLHGYDLPEDTVVFVNQWSVNHDGAKWKEPETFEPGRFLDPDGSVNRALADSVMIFSAGKRRCLGDQLAKTQMFLFTAILIHQCAFEANPGDVLSLDCLYGLSLKPLPFKLRVRLRDTYRGVGSPA
uniref:Uncharacterized protein n=1 Tax=Callorhinchus milii TaxID=7868 RepID=A0A4W3J707_CALMI